MPVYKFKDGRKGWYFQGYFEGKKYKKENWQKQKMLTKNEALIAEREYLDQLKKEKALVNDRTLMLLSDVSKAFLDYYSPRHAAATNLSHEKNLRLYILPFFENKRLCDITDKDMLNWYVQTNQLDVGLKYRNKIRQTFLYMFEYCEDNFDLPHKLIIPLKDAFQDFEAEKKEDKVFYTVEQFDKFIEQFDKDSMQYALFTLLFWTGLRIGELGALLVRDYNHENKTIDVNKQYIRLNGVDIIQRPKTQNSYRTVALDPDTNEILNNYIILYKLKSNDYLFGEKKPVRQQLIRRWCNKASDLAKLPRIKIHELRHSHASYLRSIGYDEYIIAARLGNTPQISRTVYIHTGTNEQMNLALNLRNKSQK